MKDMPIGINPIIINEEGKILLGRRAKNYYGEGTYCLPGGKLREKETFEECIIREVFEETGLIVKEEDIKIINISNTITNKHFIQIGVVINKYEGIPVIKELEKCDDLGFFDLDNLPDIFPPNLANIMLYKNNLVYDKSLNLGE